MKNTSPQIVLCNGADLPKQWANIEPIILEYRELVSPNSNVKLALPDFIRDVFYLPKRILDLLEIAAYVYCADRRIFRGHNSNLEFHSWARSFHFVVKVRDYDFWNTPEVKEKLKEALLFMSGDRAYHFTFQPGHSTPQTGLFDDETCVIEPLPNNKVILFSGGLDSLAGVVEQLEHSSDQLWLISHQSGQPKTIKTQRQLIKALCRFYPNRIRHYKFHCSLRRIRAKEESQRTRAFLYTSIGYALSCVLQQREIFVYENGVTSINFPKRQDQINARASRTTHPRTIVLLENLFSVIEDSKIKITTPFLWKTKTDIFNRLAELGRKDLITSTVSCSQTFRHLGQATHCGGCSQCIDRRFAAYGSKLDDVDEGGIYTSDFIMNEIKEDKVRTTLIDYVRLANKFASFNLETFYREMLGELAGFIDYVPGANDQEKIEKIWDLCYRHGKHIGDAIRRMREIHDNPYNQLQPDSFLQIIAKREYLMSEKSHTNGMEIFCAYSHEDEELREKLGKHLAPLRRQGIITDWYDRKMSAGKEWEAEIDEHLNSAHVILLLVSSDFIDSYSCYDVEMKRALERHKDRDARVIPIILRPVVDWERLPFGKLLALPTDGRAVTLWENQDEAFTNVAKGIAEVVEELNQT